MREEVERTKALNAAHDRPDPTKSNDGAAQASATTKHHHICANAVRYMYATRLLCFQFATHY